MTSLAEGVCLMATKLRHTREVWGDRHLCWRLDWPRTIWDIKWDVLLGRTTENFHLSSEWLVDLGFKFLAFLGWQALSLNDHRRTNYTDVVRDKLQTKFLPISPFSSTVLLLCHGSDGLYLYLYIYIPYTIYIIYRVCIFGSPSCTQSRLQTPVVVRRGCFYLIHRTY